MQFIKKMAMAMGTAMLLVVSGGGAPASAGSWCGVDVTPQYGPAPTDSNLATFLGQWGDGTDTWGGAMCHVLIVQEVRYDQTVVALYIVGDFPRQGVKRKAYRIEGQIHENSMAYRIPWQGGMISLTYSLASDNNMLDGRYQYGGYPPVGIQLSKVKNPDARL